ncbi:MAG: sortase [bacterium]|nr:MAG: sortase [bacterium]
MRSNGLIYSSEWGKNSGQVYISISKFGRFLYRATNVIGGGLLGFAVIGITFSFYPVIKEEFSYRFKTDTESSRFGNMLSQITAENSAIIKEEANNLGIDPYFSVHIPKINAKANVISNVDPGKKEEYMEALQDGIAHAKGTYFPGQDKSIYLFSHSTDSFLNFARYNAVFYLLGKLEKGDIIEIYFLDKKYEYEVTEKVITKPEDISWLQREGRGEELILQTCDPPGTTWNRLVVVAVPVK